MNNHCKNSRQQQYVDKRVRLLAWLLRNKADATALFLPGVAEETHDLLLLSEVFYTMGLVRLVRSKW